MEPVGNKEADTPEEEGFDTASGFEIFIAYLETEKGHEVASRILKMFEDIKKAALDRSSEHIKFEKLLQVGIIGLVVTASSILTYHGKFDSSVAVLFGTLVGYLFGKK